MNVEVLYGGVGGERAVSLCSGARVAAALRARGAHVSATDWNGVVSAELLQKCGAADAVFLALHGGAGETRRNAGFSLSRPAGGRFCDGGAECGGDRRYG